MAPVSDTQRSVPPPPSVFAFDWVLRASLGILMLLSVYTVLGDDLAQILGFGAGRDAGAVRKTEVAMPK